MVFGNPNCRPSGQNCPYGNCCTYNGECPQQWTVPDTCYYPYYQYNDGITKQIAIGISLGIFLFVLIVALVGIIIWYRKHKKYVYTRTIFKKQDSDENIDEQHIDQKMVKNKKQYQNAEDTEVIVYEDQQ